MRICLLLGLSLLLLPWISAAGELERAFQLFDEMEYKKALKLAEKVLSSPVDEPKDLVAAYRIQGLCLSADGQIEEALLAFRRLLAIDPSTQMSADLSPKLTAPFFQAVAMSQKQKPITMSHRPPQPGEILGGLELAVSVEADPLAMIKSLRVRYATGKDSREQELVMPLAKPGVVSLKLPAGLKAREVHYRVEAVNGQGGILARLQDGDQPFVLRVKLKGAVAATPAGAAAAPGKGKTALAVPPPRSTGTSGTQPPPRDKKEEDQPAGTPWYKTWWFWTAVGVVVAGTATGAALAVASGSSSGPADYGIRVK